MKIISYNVNGIRSAISKGLLDWMQNFGADMYCFQEIKADASAIPTALFEDLGYKTYFFPAQKKGYSGVGIATKILPNNVIYGCNNDFFDAEGRVIQLDFDHFSLLNIYFPSGSSGHDRQQLKMQFLAYITTYIEAVKAIQPNILICGDFNICRQPIDIHDPVRNANVSGFLPEERNWFQSFVDLGFTDSFRFFYPDKKDIYSWWSFRANARNNNKGWRIDYHLTTNSMIKYLKAADIFPQVKHADHCPVFIELAFD